MNVTIDLSEQSAAELHHNGPHLPREVGITNESDLQSGLLSKAPVRLT